MLFGSSYSKRSPIVDQTASRQRRHTLSSSSARWLIRLLASFRARANFPRQARLPGAALLACQSQGSAFGGLHGGPVQRKGPCPLTQR